MKIDMVRLKAELRNTAILCREARINYQDSQRPPLEGKRAAWRTALDKDTVSKRMTRLCVFRAHLRGVQHLTKTRDPVDVDRIIADIKKEFAMSE